MGIGAQGSRVIAQVGLYAKLARLQFEDAALILPVFGEGDRVFAVEGRRSELRL